MAEDVQAVNGNEAANQEAQAGGGNSWLVLVAKVFFIQFCIQQLIGRFGSKQQGPAQVVDGNGNPIGTVTDVHELVHQQLRLLARRHL